MELTFKLPEQSGWRGRGAPRKKVPSQILDLLAHARDTGEVGVISTEGDTDDEIREVMSALRAGGRQLQLHLRLQQDPGEIRFRVGAEK